MTTDVIYEEYRSDWSHQVSAVETTRWLQRDQTLPLSTKGVVCETLPHSLPLFLTWASPQEYLLAEPWLADCMNAQMGRYMQEK